MKIDSFAYFTLPESQVTIAIHRYVTNKYEFMCFALNRLFHFFVEIKCSFFYKDMWCLSNSQNAMSTFLRKTFVGRGFFQIATQKEYVKIEKRTSSNLCLSLQSSHLLSVFRHFLRMHCV